jgi:hypothetical protein
MKKYLNDSGLTRVWDKVKTLVGAKSDKVAVMDHGTSDTTYEIAPNVLHRWGTVTSLDISLGTAEAGYAAEYMIEFVSGSTPTQLQLPVAVTWDDKLDTPLTIEADKVYQISIEHNLGLLVSFNNDGA